MMRQLISVFFKPSAYTVWPRILSSRLQYASSAESAMMIKKRGPSVPLESESNSYHPATLRDIHYDSANNNSQSGQALSSFEKGDQLYKSARFSESLAHFGRVVDLLGDKKVINLTEKEAKILCDAFAYMGDTLRVGSLKDEEKALEYVKKALEISPTHPMANKIKNAILSDWEISPVSMYSGEPFHP